MKFKKMFIMVEIEKKLLIFLSIHVLFAGCLKKYKMLFARCLMILFQTHENHRKGYTIDFTNDPYLNLLASQGNIHSSCWCLTVYAHLME